MTATAQQGCHAGAMCRRVGRSWHLQRAASATQLPFFLCTLTLHMLCHSLSRGSHLQTQRCHHPSVSTTVQQSPQGATMAHTFSSVLHIDLGNAQCPTDTAGDEPTTSLCPTRLNPQHLPQLLGRKGSWYLTTIPNQHPSASSQLSPSRGERMRSRLSHPLVC